MQVRKTQNSVELDVVFDFQKDHVQLNDLGIVRWKAKQPALVQIFKNDFIKVHMTSPKSDDFKSSIESLNSDCDHISIDFFFEKQSLPKKAQPRSGIISLSSSKEVLFINWDGTIDNPDFQLFLSLPIFISKDAINAIRLLRTINDVTPNVVDINVLMKANQLDMSYNEALEKYVSELHKTFKRSLKSSKQKYSKPLTAKSVLLMAASTSALQRLSNKLFSKLALNGTLLKFYEAQDRFIKRMSQIPAQGKLQAPLFQGSAKKLNVFQPDDIVMWDNTDDNYIRRTNTFHIADEDFEQASSDEMMDIFGKILEDDIPPPKEHHEKLFASKPKPAAKKEPNVLSDLQKKPKKETLRRVPSTIMLFSDFKETKKEIAPELEEKPKAAHALKRKRSSAPKKKEPDAFAVPPPPPPPPPPPKLEEKKYLHVSESASETESISGDDLDLSDESW